MIRLADDAFHAHLLARMQPRGILREEIETPLNPGWPADDAKPGTLGKVWVFPYTADWDGREYPEKAVPVYDRIRGAGLVVLTAKARDGISVPRQGERNAAGV